MDTVTMLRAMGGATNNQVADEIEALRQRVQELERQGCCAECGKRSSDGWALCCVECMDEE